MSFRRYSIRLATASLAAILSWLPVTAQGGDDRLSVEARKASTETPVSSNETTPGYAVKASEVWVPEGVKLGQYRRVIRPFNNWTLVCDENLDKKQKVCNVSQSIIGPSGGIVFSWSLAGTDNGQPIFILRAPVSVGVNALITLDLGEGGKVIPSSVTGCDERFVSRIFR